MIAASLVTLESISQAMYRDVKIYRDGDDIVDAQQVGRASQ